MSGLSIPMPKALVAIIKIRRPLFMKRRWAFARCFLVILPW